MINKLILYITATLFKLHYFIYNFFPYQLAHLILKKFFLTNFKIKSFANFQLLRLEKL